MKGQTASARSVSCQSIRSITAIMPMNIAAEVMMGKTPFMLSVWMANVSAITRYRRSPTSRVLWKRSESRCRCW